MPSRGRKGSMRNACGKTCSRSASAVQRCCPLIPPHFDTGFPEATNDRLLNGCRINTDGGVDGGGVGSELLLEIVGFVTAELDHGAVSLLEQGFHEVHAMSDICRIIHPDFRMERHERSAQH